jgi:hypothetical protein
MGKRISKKYLDLVTPEMVGDRMSFLLGVAASLETKLFSDSNLEVTYCPIRLNNTIYSFFYEKERHKDFHGSVEPNEGKKSALLSKWICKIRPFSISTKSKATLCEQEFFYTALINPLICAHLVQGITQPKSFDFFNEKLLYEMHYGEPSTNMLMAVFDRTK